MNYESYVKKIILNGCGAPFFAPKPDGLEFMNLDELLVAFKEQNDWIRKMMMHKEQIKNL